MGSVTVQHEGGDRFAILVRDHVVVVDQPVDAGGENNGPTPTELFVASLAACVAHYARRYLARHDLPEDPLIVVAEYNVAERPSRVGEIDVSLSIPPGVPAERLQPLVSVASHCLVHNSIENPPVVRIHLEDAAETAA